MLLETLNKCHRSTSPGQLVYDFCYLPIDFKNRCNLGYAFVNFVDAAFAAECYMAFNAKRWNDFNSKKVCAFWATHDLPSSPVMFPVNKMPNC